MTADRRKPELATLRRTTSDLAALTGMTPQELAAMYRKVFGSEPPSYSRERLLRQIAYRLQEQEQGGLSPAALQRIDALGEEVPPAWHERLAQARLYGQESRQPPASTTRRARAARRAEPAIPAQRHPAKGRATVAPRVRKRDPRLPPPGTVLTRLYDGQEHRVVVRDGWFEYAGRPFRSLTAIARHITGTPWNGYYFFQDALQQSIAGGGAAVTA
jgi:AraC-like DNA-binding protein